MQLIKLFNCGSLSKLIDKPGFKYRITHQQKGNDSLCICIDVSYTANQTGTRISRHTNLLRIYNLVKTKEEPAYNSVKYCFPFNTKPWDHKNVSPFIFCKIEKTFRTLFFIFAFGKNYKTAQALKGLNKLSPFTYLQYHAWSLQEHFHLVVDMSLMAYDLCKRKYNYFYA